jgi:hypothetical protein
MGTTSTDTQRQTTAQQINQTIKQSELCIHIGLKSHGRDGGDAYESESGDDSVCYV